ncbi:MAG: FKBP-type peptidyl-prolyl cis-trans isomerase [Pseudomonadota bacterium]
MSEKYTDIESQASYGIGYQMGQQLASNPFDGLVLEDVIDGFRSGFAGSPLDVSKEALNAAFEEIQQRMTRSNSEKHADTIKQGEEFLENNAKREEVTVTSSGLQYEVINSGDGATPGLSSTVRTHYHGTLIDGSVFDSSYDRGQPAEFPVNGVIKGWTEALQLMKVGDKLRLYVPYNLAYGEQGAGAAIGPYTTLIFDVELLDIVS